MDLIYPVMKIHDACQRFKPKVVFPYGFKRQDSMKAQILHADYVITMNSKNEVIEDAAILVSPLGSIQNIGPANKVIQENPGIPVLRLANRLLMPGLINAHAHSGLLRGTAEGLPVWEWLQKFIDPMHRVLTKEEAEIASYLCYGESLLCGSTTVVDMWRYMEGSAKAAAELGNRAVLVPYVAEHPDHDYFETLDSNESLLKHWHQGANGRIQVWVGLEHMFYALPEAWKRTIAMAKDYNTGFHTHSNESKFDTEEAERPLRAPPYRGLG
jgi:5-methylthioadenosine/S-adenosylhomocysteine deaminase